MNRPRAMLAIAVVSFVGLSAREQGQTREFTITGRDHRYSPARLEVNKDDLVKITRDLRRRLLVDHLEFLEEVALHKTVDQFAERQHLMVV